MVHIAVDSLSGNAQVSRSFRRREPFLVFFLASFIRHYVTPFDIMRRNRYNAAHTFGSVL